MQRLQDAHEAGSLVLPPATPEATSAIPQMSEALAMLQRGEGEALRSAMPALLAQLLPLLELANDEMQLGWSLDKIRH